MNPMETEHVREFRSALMGWTDERFASRKQLEELALFSLYVVNLADDAGWQYNGHSWKEGQGMGCLTVKATLDDIPYVVFTSGRTYTSSVGIFLRKLEADLLEWVADRYR